MPEGISAPEDRNLEYENLDERILRAIDLIEATHGQAEPVTEGKLAHAVNMSVSRFAHLFRQQTGLAPIQMLRALKLQKACSLLIETRLSLKEIAWLAGFPTATYFARVFKKTVAETPSEYRRKRHGLESVSHVESLLSKTKHTQRTK